MSDVHKPVNGGPDSDTRGEGGYYDTLAPHNDEFYSDTFTDEERDMMADLSPLVEPIEPEDERYWDGNRGEWVQGRLEDE